jgi:hypothetical protein
MAVGCGANFGGFPRLGTERTLRRSEREPTDSRKEVHLCSEAHRPLRAHAFYARTLVDIAF